MLQQTWTVRARAASGAGQAAGGPQQLWRRREDGARLPPAGRAPAVPPRPTRSGKPLGSAGMLTGCFRLRGGAREEMEKRI